MKYEEKQLKIKTFEIKFIIHGKPHALRIEGAASLADAVKYAEMVLHKFLNLNTDICGAFEVFNGGVTR